MHNKKSIQFSLTLLFFAFLFSAGLYSCTCKEACSTLDWQCKLEFKGFSASELNTLVLKSYDKGSSIIRDSVIYTNIGVAIELPAYDTIRFIEFKGNDYTDYRFSAGLPSTGIYYYYLTDMVFQGQECRSCAKRFQINSLTSYRLNGALSSDRILMQK